MLNLTMFLYGLAPNGVYHASFVTKTAVCSYHTFSPLPKWRYIFCGTFLRSPSLDVIQHFDPEEPGLSSIKFMAVIQPSAILYYLFIYFICQILYYFFNFKSSSNIASFIHFSSSSLSSLLLLSNSKDKYLYFFKSDKVFL